MKSGEIKQRLYNLGADLCGIANIERFENPPKGYHPLDVLPTCKSVIVFAKRFLAGTLACKSNIPYTIIRNILSDKMDKMGVEFCLDLEKENILAVPTGTIYSEVDENTQRERAIVSAKHSAELAGLGTIGRHSLLITPQFGSMVWLSVILTELELEQDNLLTPICNDCNLCVDICPVNALENREMAQSKCWNHAFGEINQLWQISCHRCRDICPYNFGTENISLYRKIQATKGQSSCENNYFLKTEYSVIKKM